MDLPLRHLKMPVVLLLLCRLLADCLSLLLCFVCLDMCPLKLTHCFCCQTFPVWIRHWDLCRRQPPRLSGIVQLKRISMGLRWPLQYLPPARKYRPGMALPPSIPVELVSLLP